MNTSETVREMQGPINIAQPPIMLTEALKYAERGWPVFPCKPNKQPYIEGGFKSASTDEATLRDWWSRWPNAMIAAPTGRPIGAWVLDVDDEAAFASVERELALPATRTSRTGKGRHIFFAYDESEAVRNAQKCRDLPGTDIRGDGGYVILPPSLHPNGIRYAWERDEDPSEASSTLMAIVQAQAEARTAPPIDRDRVPALPQFSPVRVTELGLRLEGPGAVSEAARLATIVTPKGFRSEAVGRFVAEAIREGWTDCEIGGTLLHTAHGISDRIREQADPLREISRAIDHYRALEQIPECSVPHIRDYPVIDWAAFSASGKRRPPVAANDAHVDIVRSDMRDGRKPFEFVRVGDLEYAEPDWIVDGIIEASSLALIFGDPGSGKSFIAIDLAACVATGTQFHGRDVASGAVFYIAGEGHSGLRRRFTAWEQGKSLSLNEAPLFTSRGAANFLDAESASRVADAVASLASECPPRLIIVDTLARNFGDGDENSTKDMNAFVAAMDDLRRAYPDATVLIVHHSGHGDKSRARGAMALKGALDAEYQVTMRGDMVSLASSKMKEAAKPAQISFNLIPVDLGVDKHGEIYGSARLQAIENLKEAKCVRPLTGNALLVAQTYAKIAAERAVADLDNGVPRGEWRAAFYAAYGNPNSGRAIFSTQLKALCHDAPTADDGLCVLREDVLNRLAAS